MAIDFSSKSWGDEIADVTESLNFQTCEIRVTWSAETIKALDYNTGKTAEVKKVVSQYGLDLIRLQKIIDNPSSTQTEIDNATAEYAVVAIQFLNELELPDTSEIWTEKTFPAPGTADVWVKLFDRDAVPFILESGAWVTVPVNTVVYSGQARFIPVRAGVWQGGEAQLNAATIRAVRFQVPRSARGVRIHAGAIVTITKADFNANLVGRSAKVNDDFQGSTTATRTFHATMDSDSEDEWR